MSHGRHSRNESWSVGPITGTVVAVGPGARAVQRVELHEHREELLVALEELREALSRTPVDRTTRGACEECVRSLEAETRKEKPDPKAVGTLLGRVASHLKSAGVVLRETLALREPIETIAGLVGTSLTVLGLL